MIDAGNVFHDLLKLWVLFSNLKVNKYKGNSNENRENCVKFVT
jgi:hypothetical protein